MKAESHRRPRAESSRRPIPEGYLFVAPAVILLAFTSLYPTVYTLVLSLFDWKWGQERSFVGLANYAALLSDGLFWRALGQTFYFAAGAVCLELALGLAMALAVNRITVGAGLIRTVLLTPLLISGIIVALVSKIMLDPMLGIVNYLAGAVGLPPGAFFGSTLWAMPTVILVDAWWQTPFVFIVLLAGLQSLPREPYEAAVVDGAGRWQQFRFITLPLLRPVLLTVLVFRTIDCLKVFAIIFGTTNGGPDLATEVMQTMIYRTAFKVLHISEAMTITVVFSALILIVSMTYLYLDRSSQIRA